MLISGEQMKLYAIKFYKSKSWRECRDAFFFYRQGVCERCGEPGEIVHHKTYITPANINEPVVTLNWDNLELLCKDCHNREHGSQVTGEDYYFDENGDLALFIPPSVNLKVSNCKDWMTNIQRTNGIAHEGCGLK